ncbi:MAG: hypothetical protein JSV86_18545 [Gemmatimonadota bacterium]|nr:MAG: hypothetical protein JSV86_18545 [Gemmatimonadota bacterium]
MRIGELTVLRSVAPRAYLKRPVAQLELRCDCGRLARRRVDYLLQIVKGNHRHTPMCCECLREWRRGIYIERRAMAREYFAKLWWQTGRLYGDLWEWCEAESLRDAFASAGMAITEEFRTAPGVDYAALELCGRGADPARPVAPVRYFAIETEIAYRCTDCRKHFQAGWGCLSCAEPVCAKCVRNHDCADVDRGTRPTPFDETSTAHTLEEVAHAFGVSRERIRQMQNKAIRKLRHPTRLKELQEFAADGARKRPRDVSSDWTWGGLLNATERPKAAKRARDGAALKHKTDRRYRYSPIMQHILVDIDVADEPPDEEEPWLEGD